MHPVQKHLFDTNFKDLAGTRIEGTIVVSEDLINLGIMDFINGLKAPATPPGTPASPAASSSAGMPDPKALLQVLNVEKLNVRMEKGKLLVDVKAGI